MAGVEVVLPIRTIIGAVIGAAIVGALTPIGGVATDIIQTEHLAVSVVMNAILVAAGATIGAIGGSLTEKRKPARKR